MHIYHTIHYTTNCVLDYNSYMCSNTHFTLHTVGINIALSLASSTYTAANITANNTTNTILNTHTTYTTTKQAMPENPGSGTDSDDDYSDGDGGVGGVGGNVYKTDVFNTIRWMKIYRIVEMCIRYIEKLNLEITSAGENIYGSSSAGGGMGDAYI